MRLSERAMLASLHVGAWTGQLIDRKVTEEVNASHSAESDAGRYTKQLIASKFLRQVGAKAGNARRVHNLLTLPWDDDGTRILSAVAHPTYTEKMRQERMAVEAAVDEFVNGMPHYIEEAKRRLGSMFNEDEYPGNDEVRRKFYLDVEFKPVPEAGDFRAELSDASVKAITKDIERRVNDRVEQAIRDVFSRVADVTGKMAERLNAFKPAVDGSVSEGRFRDSLVLNVVELANLLPTLNITGDKRIDELHKRLLADLSVQPDILRSNDKVRNDTAAKAQRIYDKVNEYLA